MPTKAPPRFTDITYPGPPIDDPELLAELPGQLADVLRETNGLVAFRGGFHLRGACLDPDWHSLRAAWRGPESFAARYSAVRPTDVPFAQDALGDQFLLRDGIVFRLRAETGEIESLGRALRGFLEAAGADPVTTLELQPLLQFEMDGGRLQPGQLLSAYPPFCTSESANGVSLRAIPARERLGFLAHLAKQIADLPDGTVVKVGIVP